MKPLSKKSPAANNPINPPMSGNKNMYSADVATKSSPLPMGIIVRKASKSLKVFIAFDLDIYPIHSPKWAYRLCCEHHGGTQRQADTGHWRRRASRAPPLQKNKPPPAEPSTCSKKPARMIHDLFSPQAPQSTATQPRCQLQKATGSTRSPATDFPK